MRSTPVYEVHAVKYAHLPRKAWEVQITPDPHDADFPMDYFVWVAIPLDESGNRMLGGKPIVIDTGFNATIGKKRGREVKTNPADLLAHVGVDAREVEDEPPHRSRCDASLARCFRASRHGRMRWNARWAVS